MAKTGFNVVNIYGSVIVGIASLKVHIFEGQQVFNKTTGKMVIAPALGAGGLDANHEIIATAIPHTDNKIGFEMTIPDDLSMGTFDLVYLDALVYKGGVRFNKQADGTIVIIPE